MTALSPRANYEQRIDRFDQAIALGERRHRLYAGLRLTMVGVGVATAWLAFDANALSPLWLVAPMLGFLALVVAHARVLERQEREVRARDLYARGMKRIDGQWAGTGPDGATFLHGHPYAHDLDLFGQGSLFQLLDTARTEAGEETLAAWLAVPATIEEVAARQEAVRELAPQVDFRERLAVVAAEARVGRRGALAAWAGRPSVGLPWSAAVLHGVVGAILTGLIVVALAGRVGTVVVVTWAGVAIGVFAWWRRRVDAVIHAVDAASDDLAVFAHVLAVIEGSTASAPRLAALGARLRRDGRPPSALLAALQRHVSLLNQCEHNPYARVVSTPLLARAQLAVAIDRWHAAHRTALADWLAVVGEFEALAALATYAYEHPDDPLPSVVSDGPRFEARDLAHPLLPGTGGVANDVRIGGDDPHLLIVSGSNMSGKSTMLRAVGVNTVLALAGAPVRASSLTLSPLAIGATITVDDSLQAGHSRFYTEVLRLKAIVDLARREPVLFLLDEILHGTNSHDRRVGAEAILRTLVGTGAIGLVTTHDLALTSLAASLGPAAANVHFQDHIEDGRMVFDYQMRPGVVEHSNALALMRAVGLDV
jgi:hypothetical protein